MEINIDCGRDDDSCVVPKLFRKELYENREIDRQKAEGKIIKTMTIGEMLENLNSRKST